MSQLAPLVLEEEMADARADTHPPSRHGRGHCLALTAVALASGLASAWIFGGTRWRATARGWASSSPAAAVSKGSTKSESWWTEELQEGETQEDHRGCVGAHCMDGAEGRISDEEMREVFHSSKGHQDECGYKADSNVGWTGHETVSWLGEDATWEACCAECKARASDHPPCAAWVLNPDGYCYQKYDTGITIEFVDAPKGPISGILQRAPTTTPAEKDCLGDDDDQCLQQSPQWGSTYSCQSAAGYCMSWAKDMVRCCPHVCGASVLTEADCGSLAAHGTCIYPNAVQACSGPEPAPTPRPAPEDAPETPMDFRLRRTQTFDPNRGWCWDVGEVQFFADSGCSKEVAYSGIIESGNAGGYWAGEKAFDGSQDTNWGGRPEAEESFIGLQGCEEEVKCVVLFQPGSEDQCTASKVAVEKLLPSGLWFTLVEQDVAAQASTTIAVPTGLSVCDENEHVVDKKCAPCPDGQVNPSGDDPRNGDTGCKKPVPVHSFDVGATIAMQFPWTWVPSRTLEAQPKQPSSIHIAACHSQVIVTWTSQEIRPFDYDNQWQRDGDTFGHVTSFSASGKELTMKTNYKMPDCSEMGGVTATPDCSVIAALCISRKDAGSTPNFKHDVVRDNADESGKPPFGWDDVWEQQPDPESAKRQILNAYLFEWTSGAVGPEPDMSALVSTAVGGWRYGTWSVVVSEDASAYSVTLKTTLYGGGTYHEGAVRFTLARPSLALQEKENHWACGTGHVMWNAQAYNNALGKPGYWCWTDGAGEGHPPSNAIWFTTSEPGSEKLVNIQPFSDISGNEDWSYGGGPTDIVSTGAKGWLGVFAVLEDAHSSSGQKVGLATLPEGQVKLLDLAKPGMSVSWPHLARFGGTSEDGDTFLLGWSDLETSSTWDNKMPQPSSFHLARVDSKGDIKDRHPIAGTSWTDTSEWATIPDSGAVVWAHVWSDSAGPNGKYGSWEQGPEFDGLYSSTLRLTIVYPE